jgi:hypothetical protein
VESDLTGLDFPPHSGCGALDWPAFRGKDSARLARAAPCPIVLPVGLVAWLLFLHPAAAGQAVLRDLLWVCAFTDRLSNLTAVRGVNIRRQQDAELLMIRTWSSGETGRNPLSRFCSANPCP